MLTKEPGGIGWIFIRSVENICMSSAGRIVWHQIQKSNSRAKAESAASQMGTIRENSLKENLSGCEGHRVSTEGRRRPFVCLLISRAGGGGGCSSISNRKCKLRRNEITPGTHDETQDDFVLLSPHNPETLCHQENPFTLTWIQVHTH